MFSKRIAVLAAASISISLISTSAICADAQGWKGPGWYLITNFMGWMIQSGPFAAQDQCTQQITPNTMDTCKYLGSQAEANQVIPS